jgi:hypothetical protein
VKVGCTVDGSTSPYYAKLIMISCPFTMVAISFSIPNELDGFLDWEEIQTLVRSMPDLHKTLILAYVQETTELGKYKVEEIAIATEHAPFRHRNVITEVGAQRKKSMSKHTNAPIMKI